MKKIVALAIFIALLLIGLVLIVSAYDSMDDSRFQMTQTEKYLPDGRGKIVSSQPVDEDFRTTVLTMRNVGIAALIVGFGGLIIMSTRLMRKTGYIQKEKLVDTTPQQTNFCDNCGQKVAVGTPFCPKCGKKL